VIVHAEFLHHATNRSKLSRVRVEARDTQMAADEEDLPTTYLLYAAAVIAAIVAAAVGTFFILFR